MDINLTVSHVQPKMLLIGTEIIKTGKRLKKESIATTKHVARNFKINLMISNKILVAVSAKKPIHVA